MTEIALRGELWDNDSADILRFWGWRDVTCPGDICTALEKAGGGDVTLLINSPGGDMAVGLEIRSILRRYPGQTTALYQGFGASAATLAASGCRRIESEPGALLCYHNPAGTAEGDYHDMAQAAQGLQNARDCALDVYTARAGTKSREELAELMDKNIWITPRQAYEYGLIDAIAGDDGKSADPAAFVAASGCRIRLTEAMRQQYRQHVAAEKSQKAKQIMARARVLNEY